MSGSIEEALAAIESSAQVNYAATALEFNVSRETLWRHHKGLQQSRRDADFNYKTLLTKVQEEQLLAYIKKLTGRGLPPTYQMLRNFAQDLCGKVPRKN
jgi:hypothetical protein